MERLPPEIKHDIFKLITNQDKITCLSVSRIWREFIKPYVFENVKIQNDRNLTNAITYFEMYPEIASTVKHFEIKRCNSILLYLPQIQELFRNLKKLVLSRQAELQLTYPPENACVLGVWDNLKELHISEPLNRNNPISMTEQILSNSCPNLTKLSLDFLNIFRETRLTAVPNLLQNAPQLLQLDISSCYGPLSVIEDLHQSAPNLKSLRLDLLDWTLLDTPTVLDTPTGSLNTVQLDDLYLVTIVEGDMTFIFDYIVGKYTGLKSFSITTMVDDYSSFHKLHTAELEERILPLFTSCPQLTYYNQSFLRLTPTIVEEMDRCGIQLKAIKLYVDQQTGKFQCIALNNSDQRQTVNHVFLRLLYMDEIEFEFVDQSLDAYIIPQALESLSNLSNLTKLTLQSSGNLFCFKEFPVFLNKLPQLLTLSIQDMTLTSFYGNYTDELTILSLKSIEIRNLKTSSTSFAVGTLLKKLLHSCPDLEEFQLHISLEENSNDVLLNFVMLNFTSNPKLKTIDIDSKGDRNQYLIQRTDMQVFSHDKVRDLWIKMPFLVCNEYYTAIVISQPVLINSHKVY